jgi:hypothetical protein
MERVCNNVLRTMSPNRKVYDENELIIDMSQMPVKKKTVEQQKMKVVVAAVTMTMMTVTTVMIIVMIRNYFLTITTTVGYEMGPQCECNFVCVLSIKKQH